MQIYETENFKLNRFFKSQNFNKFNNIKISNGSQSYNSCYSWSLWSFCSQTQPSKVRMVHLR